MAPSDPSATRAWLEESAWVQRLARRLVRESSQAEDLAQEALRLALERPPAASVPFRSWLGGVVRNLARVARRGDARRQARELATARTEAIEGSERLAERLEVQERLVAAVRGLDEPYRTTVALRYLEDLSTQDVAARMQVPVKTVHTRLERALEQLRARLDREHGSRAAWAGLLVPLSVPPPPPAPLELAGPAVAVPLLAMGTATKWTAASVTVAALGFFAFRSLDQGTREADSAPRQRISAQESASGGRTENAGLAVPTPTATRTQMESLAPVATSSTSVDRLEPLLAALRASAPLPGFHALAWPILGEVAALLREDPQPATLRLMNIVHGKELDVDRVRSACLLALALCASPAAATLAQEFLNVAPPELERAGWIALGLIAAGPEGMAVELVNLRSVAGQTTYPARFEREAPEAVIAAGIARLQAQPSAALLEVSSDLAGNMPRLEEQYTRCIVVTTVLGPASGHEGPVRDVLLRWLRGAPPLALLADDAVLQCLAQAAQEDEDLARTLLEFAGSRLYEPEGTAILQALVRFGRRDELVLDLLESFFATEEAIEGDPLFLLTQVGALDALKPLIASEDPLLRQAAGRITMERLQDPNLDSTERLLLMTLLATEQPEHVLATVQSLVSQGDEDALRRAIGFLDAVPPEEREASQDLLLALLARPSTSSATRLALLREISQVGAEGAREVLLSLRSMEQDPAAIALLEELLPDSR